MAITRSAVLVLVLAAGLMSAACKSITTDAAHPPLADAKAMADEAAVRAGGLYAQKSGIKEDGGRLYAFWCNSFTAACTNTGLWGYIEKNGFEYEDVGKCSNGETIRKATQK